MTIRYTLSRLLPAILACILLFISPVISVSAREPEEESTVTEWSFSLPDSSLTATYPATEERPGSTITYRPHELEGTPAWARLSFIKRETVYRYYNELPLGTDTYSFSSPYYAGDVVFMSTGSDEHPIPYFTDASAARLTALLNGTGVSGHILRIPRDNGSGFRAVTDEVIPETWTSFFAALTAAKQEEPLNPPLRDLRFLTPTVVYAMGNPTWFSVPTHFIYTLEDRLYVIPADTLTDAQFQSGSLNTSLADRINLYPLSDQAVSLLRELTDASQSDLISSQTELPPFSIPDNPNISAPDEDMEGVAYVSVIFCGLLVPIAPFVVGIVKGCRHKKPHSARWFWLTAAAGAWMLMAILLFIVLLL